MELVVKQPQHPYTQLLMSSIPLAGAERTWTTDTGRGTAGIMATDSVGCKFADRCSFAMATCLQAMPPLFHTDHSRAVSCYLYHSAAVLAGEEIGKAFRPPYIPA